MIRPSTEIRSATSEEMPHAVAAIVAAFVIDPAARFAWPAARDYFNAMPLAVHEFAGACFEQGTAYIAADLCGTALWLPPGVQPNGEALEKVFRDTAKPEHMDDLLATFEKMDQSHPKEAHWYLPMIGVDPKAIARLRFENSAHSPHVGERAGLQMTGWRSERDSNPRYRFKPV